MGRRSAVVVLLALVASCAPATLPRGTGGTPNGPAAAVTTTDLLTLREGGQNSSLVVRKAATGELVRDMPDGLLLPGGTTLLAVKPDRTSTALRTIDRRTGAAIASRSVSGTWTLQRGASGYQGVSPDGRFAVLAGSAYNFTDASGTWTAKTSFAVVDTALASDPRVLDLPGRYAYVNASVDGRSLYLAEATPVQLPTSSRLRVYDLPSGALAGVAGDPVPDPNATYRPEGVRIGGRSFDLYAASTGLSIVRLDLDARAATVLRLPADQLVFGEEMLMWSLVASRDARTLYVLNTAVGVVDEVEASTLRLRRTERIATAPPSSLVSRLLDAVHPVAYAKRGVSVGAVLSLDGATIYAIGETGIWAVETATLHSRLLARDGAYQSLALSPDGARLYALGFDDGIVRVVSARDGSLLGAMPRSAYPSEIVAVDAS